MFASVLFEFDFDAELQMMWSLLKCIASCVYSSIFLSSSTLSMCMCGRKINGDKLKWKSKSAWIRKLCANTHVLNTKFGIQLYNGICRLCLISKLSNCRARFHFETKALLFSAFHDSNWICWLCFCVCVFLVSVAIQCWRWLNVKFPMIWCTAASSALLCDSEKRRER